MFKKPPVCATIEGKVEVGARSASQKGGSLQAGVRSQACLQTPRLQRSRTDGCQASVAEDDMKNAAWSGYELTNLGDCVRLRDRGSRGKATS